MFFLDGKPLPPDVPFEHGGIRYPANWLRLSTAEEKAALGITEVAEQPRPDDRFYWVTDNGDGTYTAVPKNLADLKAEAIIRIKTTAGSLLNTSDWKIVRAAEGVKPTDAATLAHRAAVRTKSDEHEAAVEACTSVNELAALVLDWPEG